MEALWLFDPDVPGMKVLVVRGFWGKLMKSKEFATPEEAQVYMLFLTALKRRRYGDG